MVAAAAAKYSYAHAEKEKQAKPFKNADKSIKQKLKLSLHFEKVHPNLLHRLHR